MPVGQRYFITRIKSVVLLVALSWLVSACVTTTNRPEQVIDLKKAEATHIQAGLGYLRQQDKESARRHFYKALKLNSQSAGALNGLALVHQFEDDFEEADKFFRKALSIESDFSLARNNYGAFLYQQKRYSEAEKQLEIVAKDYTYSRRTMALLNLGRTQLKLNKDAEAEKSFKQVLKINYRVPMAQLELADLYFKQKNYTNAKFYLDQFGRSARPTPRSLWIGIRIERIYGNKDKEASYALALKNLHPYSAEYLEYKKTAE
ncbi:MAG: type IV pilus biogenesis/stability protein PilW [Cellvibrionaceae bacterium]